MAQMDQELASTEVGKSFGKVEKVRYYCWTCDKLMPSLVPRPALFSVA